MTKTTWYSSKHLTTFFDLNLFIEKKTTHRHPLRIHLQIRDPPTNRQSTAFYQTECVLFSDILHVYLFFNGQLRRKKTVFY